jgi:hypothetical protein
MPSLRIRITALAVTAIACSATTASARNADDMPLFLQGQWQVVANTIDPNRATGAFRENDPDVIGHRMRITGDAMSWMENKTSGQVSKNITMVGSCLRATYDGAMPSSGMADVRKDYAVPLAHWKISAANVLTRHDVQCAGEKSTWGPDERDAGEFLSLKSGMLIVNWQGGLVLLLRRMTNRKK